jgi:Spy/CpxP family protein refolding chaperone
MRRFRWLAVVAMIALLIAGTVAFAQGPGGRRGGAPGFAPGVELRGLDLSDSQREQIRDIVQRYQQQMQAEIMQVLTPEQQTKAKALQAERDARMKQRLEQRQQRRQNQQNP